MSKTESTTAPPAAARTGAPAATGMAVLAPLITWLVPGAGHLIQKKFLRGFILLASVVIMFWLGLAMSGKIYKPNTGDLLDILGFVGDIGAGGLYMLGRAMDWGIAPIAFAVADYGTKFIVVAGLLNVMAMVDAYHIAMGKKS